jgi:hypothetical protein
MNRTIQLQTWKPEQRISILCPASLARQSAFILFSSPLCA